MKCKCCEKVLCECTKDIEVYCDTCYQEVVTVLDEMLDVVEEINTMTGMVLTGSDGSGDDPEMAELEHAIKKALSDNEG